MFNKNPLFDKEFLELLFTKNEREIYARVTLLTLEENPIEYIEGKIIDGNISIDGASAVRRTCNLTLIADNININDFYWGLKNKFKLEVGLKNDINPIYPNIIWFKQGIFVITTFNTSQSTKNYTIKIQGKDKMCLLNGEVSGRLPSVDFAVEEYVDTATDKRVTTYLPIKTIIKKMLQEFAMEPLHNIIINDVDQAGLKILEYNGTEPFYIMKNKITQEFQMIPNNNLTCYYIPKKILTQDEYNSIPSEYDFLKDIYEKSYNSYIFNDTLALMNFEYNRHCKEGLFKGKISDNFSIIYEDLLDDNEFEGGQKATEIKLDINEEIYTLIKIEAGDIPGYIMTDLKWAGGELKSNVGETITSILDKIVRTFYNFEYYYDIDGKFIFQQKKEYLTTPWNSVEDTTEIYHDAGQNQTQTLFTFMNGKLISSFQNTPEFNNIRNDYFVQGARDNTLLRMRYAIDEKPLEYTPIRTLCEKIITITFNQDDELVSSEVNYKYHDAPEVINPDFGGYNENGLFTLENSYNFVNDILIQNKMYSMQNLVLLFKDVKYNWQNLFKTDDIVESEEERKYYFCGTNNDIKEILKLMHEQKIYDVSVDMTITTNNNGEKVWNIIYPFFSKYPYGVTNVCKKVIASVSSNTYRPGKYYKRLNNGEYILDMSTNFSIDNIYYEDFIIHYKVDWRELIYQMALDYRKLNYTDNYYYYLKQANPWLVDNKTGYEQYYIDILAGWRELYNPNPKPMLNNSFSYKDIKSQSYIINNGNNSERIIYIKNPYRLINYTDDLTQLKYSDVYRYSIATDDHSKIKSLYPYFISDIGKLNLNETYYIQGAENEMVGLEAKTINDNNYVKLNNTPIEDIQIKNVQQFTVPQEGQDEYLDFVEANNSHFKVPIYSTRSSLSTYANEQIPDYINFVNNNFESFIKDFNPFENRTTYIKDQGYQLLSKNDPLWSLYYQSDLLPLSYYTEHIINNINKIILNNYESNQYFQSVNKILKDYFIYLEETSFQDILNVYGNIIFKFLEKFKNSLVALNTEDISLEQSCLPYLLNAIQMQFENMLSLITNTTDLDYKKDYVKLINIMTNFQIYADKLIGDIQGNYDQVKSILNKTMIIKTEDETELQKIDKMTAEDMQKFIEQALQDLNSQHSFYVEGQLQKTKKEINNLSSSDNLDTQKVQLKNIIQNIYLLTDTIKNIKDIIFNQYELIHIINDPDNVDKTIQELNLNGSLYLFLLTIKNLYNLFESNNVSENQLLYSIPSLGLNNLILFSDLYYELKKSTDSINTIKEYNKKLKNFQKYIIRKDVDNFNNLKNDNIIFEPIHYCQATYAYNENKNEGNFWSKDIFTNPELLTFWFDFLEPNSLEMSKYSVSTIGIRSTAVSDTSVNAVHQKEIPHIIFRDKNLTDYNELSGYTYINFTAAFSNLFKYQVTRKTAKEKIEELLYAHSCATEKVNIQAIPIYNLEPNKRIYIRDEKCHIDGEYLINKITIPLNYNKLMSITATKSVTNII